MTLATLIRGALPLLMRERIIEAVLRAQHALGEPVTSEQARMASPEPIMRSARSFSDTARAVARLGADEQGRVLHRVGGHRQRFVRWWVEERSAET
jgi:hypothetical protein